MYRQWSASSAALLTSMNGPTKPTREECVADLNEFKKLVATSPIRSNV